MSYEKTYPNRINWEDYPSTSTPLSAENLNKMDKGTFDQDVAISAISSRLDNLTYRISKLEDPFVCYGFHISGSESDPSLKVTYLEDAVGMTPAHMNFNTGVFDYGSWENAFFMPKPCMLKRDGTVDYYLNPNDYTKKADGTASDVANTNYLGNAMMEWGQNGKKIWLKIVPDDVDDTSASVYISDKQIDDDFHDYSFHNSQGVSVDHFYTSIYNVKKVSVTGYSNAYRSMSGLNPDSNYDSFSKSITTCRANNNDSSTVMWDCVNYSDYLLITMLLILMGKSTDSSVIFGRGITLRIGSGYPALTQYTTGVHNTKGLFYGTASEYYYIATDSPTTYWENAVKVFGMENWWGYSRYWLLGLNCVCTYEDSGVTAISPTTADIVCKLTYGTEDGSTATDFNDTGENYAQGISISDPSALRSSGEIYQMRFTNKLMFPSRTQYKNMADVYNEYYADFATAHMMNGRTTQGVQYRGECYFSITPSSMYEDLNDYRSAGMFNIGARMGADGGAIMPRLACRPLAST